MTAGFDRWLVQHRFGRAAADYSRLAGLQHEVESRLLERLDEIRSPPARILDVGAGPGRAAGLLHRRFRRAQVVALDLALPMLRLARRQGSLWRPLPAVCADAAALPVADGSIDLLFSSLCLQWLDDPVAALSEFARVLRPGGLMLLATYGPDTLTELRQAWARADDRAHVSEFVPMAALGDALMALGFRDPVLDRDLFTLSYAGLDQLLDELRGIGASNARRDRSRGLLGKSAWQRMRQAYERLRDDQDRFPASYEVIYAQAHAPASGQPRRGRAGGEVASIPVEAIARRRK